MIRQPQWPQVGASLWIAHSKQSNVKVPPPITTSKVLSYLFPHRSHCFMALSFSSGAAVDAYLARAGLRDENARAPASALLGLTRQAIAVNVQESRKARQLLTQDSLTKEPLTKGALRSSSPPLERAQRPGAGPFSSREARELSPLSADAIGRARSPRESRRHASRTRASLRAPSPPRSGRTARASGPECRSGLLR